MALTTVKLGMFKDDYMNYVTLEPTEYVDDAAATRAVLTGRTLNDKYIDGLLDATQKEFLEAHM